jgi:hypothetical protein
MLMPENDPLEGAVDSSRRLLVFSTTTGVVMGWKYTRKKTSGSRPTWSSSGAVVAVGSLLGVKLCVL